MPAARISRKSRKVNAISLRETNRGTMRWPHLSRPLFDEFKVEEKKYMSSSGLCALLKTQRVFQGLWAGARRLSMGR